MISVTRSRFMHEAWQLPLGTLFFMCGILLGRIADSLFPALVLLLLTLLAASIAQTWRRAGVIMLAAATLGTGAGWFGYHPTLPPEGDYLIRGTVAQTVVWEEGGQVQTILADVTLNGTPGPDAYWTFYLAEEELPPDWLVPGAQVELTARVYHPSGAENPGGFDFREYLLQRGVHIGLFGRDGLSPAEQHFSLAGCTAGLRHDLSLRLMAVMGEDSGGYAAAMLLGTGDFIPEDERAAFHELGIAHILSISGFHAGVLAGLLLLLMKPLPLRPGWRLAAETLLLGGYCLLVGGKAPVVRAVALLLWREYARLRHRQLLPVHLLCITALLQLIFNPVQLTSASFQLTYGAMLGLILIHPWLSRRFSFKSRLAQRVWNAFSAALGAQIGVLAPQLYWFGELPLLSVPLNIGIAALAGALITLYWMTLAALPFPGVSTAMGFLADGATQLLLTAVRRLSGLGGTILWTRQADLFTLVGWTLLLFGLSGMVPRKLQRHRRTLLLLGCVLTALILLPLPQHAVTYTQFSVGNGDGAVLQDKDVTVVIDSGEDGCAVANYLHQRRQSVEVLIITHLHTDHGSGAQALLDNGVPVAVCYLPWGAETPMIDEEVLPVIDALRQSGTEIRYLARGDVLPLPSGCLTVLWPEQGRVFPPHDANDVNLVLLADIAGVTMLLPGDLPSDYIPYAVLPADILKLPHHGSKLSCTPELLTAAAPQILLQSNRLESRELHAKELAGDIPFYSTRQHGGIIIRFLGDGEFTVETVKE